MLTLSWPTPRTLMLGGGAVLVVAALASGGWYWHMVSQRHAMAAYADALTRAQPALSPQATADARATGIRELEAALKEYPSGPGAAQVAYELGNLRYDAQQYAQARGAWELAVAQGVLSDLVLVRDR